MTYKRRVKVEDIHQRDIPERHGRLGKLLLGIPGLVDDTVDGGSSLVAADDQLTLVTVDSPIYI